MSKTKPRNPHTLRAAAPSPSPADIKASLRPFQQPAPMTDEQIDATLAKVAPPSAQAPIDAKPPPSLPTDRYFLVCVPQPDYVPPDKRLTDDELKNLVQDVQAKLAKRDTDKQPGPISGTLKPAPADVTPPPLFRRPYFYDGFQQDLSGGASVVVWLVMCAVFFLIAIACAGVVWELAPILFEWAREMVDRL